MPRLLSKRIVFDVKKVLMLYSENIQYAISQWKNSYSKKEVFTLGTDLLASIN